MQVLAEINILHLADIQPLETNRSASTQAISAIELERDDFAFLRSIFMVREQTETWNTLLQRGFVLRGLEGNAAGHQTLQRLAFNLDPAGQPACEGDATGVPEARRGVDQAFVFLLDVHTNDQLFLGA
ncbi:hypothetical protein D3C87_1390400 [compost metagenome]